MMLACIALIPKLDEDITTKLEITISYEYKQIPQQINTIQVLKHIKRII